MKLIDADDFENKMYHEVFDKDSEDQRWDSGCWIRYKLFERVLKDQPTIEPKRNKGKWVERNPLNSDTCRLIECDQCGLAYIVGYNVPYEQWIKNKNFCERCGADMMREGDE